MAGAQAAARFGQADIHIVSGIRYDQNEIKTRLKQTIPTVDGIIFIGGQGDLSVPEIARANPDKKFAIVQGQNLGSNLSSYVVLQEISAFLAGCLAALSTNTGTVGHLSGHRVTPGLRGRAAFVGGAQHIDGDIKILTGFCGSQDDSNITQAWTDSIINQGADIVFTMLNGARQGAIDACRTNNIRQIGNALDWCIRDPDMFIGSAIARIDLGVMQAINDMIKMKVPEHIVEFGLQTPRQIPEFELVETAYVSLSLAEDVPIRTRDLLAQTTALLRNGTIRIPNDYFGPEFILEPKPCL